MLIFVIHLFGKKENKEEKNKEKREREKKEEVSNSVIIVVN